MDLEEPIFKEIFRENKICKKCWFLKKIFGILSEFWRDETICDESRLVEMNLDESRRIETNRMNRDESRRIEINQDESRLKDEKR